MQLSFVRPRAQNRGRHLPHGIVPFTTPSTKDPISPPPTSSVLLLDMTRTRSLRLQGISPRIQLGPSRATSSSPLHDLAPRRSQRLRKGTSPTRPTSAVSRFSIAPKRKRSNTKPAPRSPSAIDNVVDVGQATTVDQEPCAPADVAVDHVVDDGQPSTVNQEPCASVVDNIVDAGQSSFIDEEPCAPAVDNSVDDERSSTIMQERCSPPAGGNISDAGEPSHVNKCRGK
jgi:hypothetical protein